ncbi:sodium:proton antiporter [Ostreiculturibacter nitratireducens]|uniref:cation:proton antiporter n=1 Tax=Ostreiculturibacter nitratireducens TaxID=3075226 RepID=UPI0031B59657
MAIEETVGGLSPALAFAFVGALGVGSQWLAWRLRLPAIVLMLAAGLIAGPVTGIFIPSRDIGPIVGPLISLAVAVILFEGGLTLDLHKLGDARAGVRRLVVIGAPLGWLLSTLALRFGAGLSWEASTVFGGILIVTGPTVIAPMLRHARLGRRPAALLQWEAIVNDALGALAAVLAFEFVLVFHSGVKFGAAASELAIGIGFATVLGFAAGYGTARAFGRGRVPEYMKVPVLFAILLLTFALADAVLHESGLLAVTVMGLVIANADLASYEELRRFKEHASVLLVSGVFILLAASLDPASLDLLTWRAVVFVALVVLIARPFTVLISLIGTGLPFREKLLISLTGPRGVVLVAVAGLFGERLAGLGIEDGALLGPLAFALVTATVVLHGFSLAPFARFLGLAGADVPGVLLVGGSRFTTGLAEALKSAKVPVLVTDPNHGRLYRARAAGVPTFYGDILGEAAEQSVEHLHYETLIAASDNDAYNTLVATDLAPEFGRAKVWQIARAKEGKARHALPTQLGGRSFGSGRTHSEFEALMTEGWVFRVTRLTEEFGYEDWREKRPGAILLGRLSEKGEFSFVREDKLPKFAPGMRLISLLPPGTVIEDATSSNGDGKGRH